MMRDFETFQELHEADFARIARASRREWTTDDVRNEAFVLAFDIGAKRGLALDLSDPDDASLLIRYLYNRCVKYGETVVRHAQRLDHPLSGDDTGHHWLLDRLVADGGADALSLLEGESDAASPQDDPDPYHSPAAGFVWLLQRFDQRMAGVASFLLISLSWCYRCCHKARVQANRQWPLPNLSIGDSEEAIRPWRNFKLPTTPIEDPPQLPFDFGRTPAQPAHGQLWLL